MQHRLALYLPRHRQTHRASPACWEESLSVFGRFQRPLTRKPHQLPQRGPHAEAEQAQEEETSKPTMSASMFTSSHPM